MAGDFNEDEVSPVIAEGYSAVRPPGFSTKPENGTCADNIYLKAEFVMKVDVATNKFVGEFVVDEIKFTLKAEVLSAVPSTYVHIPQGREMRAEELGFMQGMDHWGVLVEMTICQGATMTIDQGTTTVIVTLNIPMCKYETHHLIIDALCTKYRVDILFVQEVSDEFLTDQFSQTYKGFSGVTQMAHTDILKLGFNKKEPKVRHPEYQSVIWRTAAVTGSVKPGDSPSYPKRRPMGSAFQVRGTDVVLCFISVHDMMQDAQQRGKDQANHASEVERVVQWAEKEV